MRKKLRVLAGVMAVVFGLMFAGCESDHDPELPVAVTFRGSAGGRGYVAEFYNLTDWYLMVLVRNETPNYTEEGYLELPPNGMRELGWMEGWTFFSGETIHLSHEDYASIRYLIP